MVQEIVMSAETNTLSVPIASFWTPVSSAVRRDQEISTASQPDNNAWDELVNWFAQEHEWLTLVSSFDTAGT
jgi:hypothetical protein